MTIASARLVRAGRRVYADGIGSHDGQERWVEGCIFRQTFASGLELLGGDYIEQQQRLAVATVQPALIVTLVEQGRVRFAYDHSEYRLRSGQGLAVNVQRMCSFERWLDPGQRQRKVHLLLTPKWLQQHSALPATLQQLISHHLQSWRWQPSAVAMDILARILELAAVEDSWQRRLQLEQQALALLVEFFSALAPATLGMDRAQQHRGGVAQAVCFVEQHLFQPLTLAQVAEAAHLSVSSLQRQFKQATGVTVIDYQRQRRLDAVYDGLRTGQLTIHQAAYQAGYRHASNFNTAFKRRFGKTPGECLVSV